MPKKAGIVFVILGAVLIGSALLLYLYNQQEDAQAGQESEELLSEVQVQISERTQETEAAITEPTEGAVTEATEPVPLDPELPVVEIEGYGYIGYLSIPERELELPVMSDWDYTRLKIAPCRQFGSSRTDDLVIAAHNYKKHFGALKDFQCGEEILFTDMDGIVSRYQVVKVEKLDPRDVLTVLESEYDLVLYTCTYGGANRIAAFCDRLPETTLSE